MNDTIRHDKDGGFTVIPEKVMELKRAEQILKNQNEWLWDDNTGLIPDMSKYAKEVSLDNIEQMLLETIADFLDEESIRLDETIGLFYDPVERDKSELHIRMAKSAMVEYRNTIVDHLTDNK